MRWGDWKKHTPRRVEVPQVMHADVSISSQSWFCMKKRVDSCGTKQIKGAKRVGGPWISWQKRPGLCSGSMAPQVCPKSKVVVFLEHHPSDISAHVPYLGPPMSKKERSQVRSASTTYLHQLLLLNPANKMKHSIPLMVKFSC